MVSSSICRMLVNKNGWTIFALILQYRLVLDEDDGEWREVKEENERKGKDKEKKVENGAGETVMFVDFSI